MKQNNKKKRVQKKPKVQCPDSPNGEHSPYTDVIEVTRDGKTEKHMMVICWWCGKGL